MARDPLPADVRLLIRNNMASVHQQAPTIDGLDSKTQDAVFTAIDAINHDMRDLSLAIHENPELGFKEVKAHANLVKALSKLGFTITNPTSLETAFVATWSNGSGGRTFGFNAEYDALPGIGHACGHNLIAIVAVASAVGCKAAMEKQGISGTIKVIGSPAEEGGGGKIILFNEGVYEGLDACAMAHPGGGIPADGYDGQAPAEGKPASLARAGFIVDFVGKPAHAGAAPWMGVNAVDAAVLGYNGVSMLRQQLEPTVRVHGVIRGPNDWVNNIIPASSHVEYDVRAPDVKQAMAVRNKAIACFESAAHATGCSHTTQSKDKDIYAELRNSVRMAGVYADIMEGVFHQRIQRDGMTTASTDFGNITISACPAVHPMYLIETDGVNHTPEFTAGAATMDSHERSIKVAKGLALLGFKVLTDDAFAKKIKDEFEEQKKRLGA